MIHFQIFLRKVNLNYFIQVGPSAILIICNQIAKTLVLFYFIQVGYETPTLSPGHDVTGGQRKNLGREWEADALVYSCLPSPPGFTMHGLPPKLLVTSVNAVLGLAHTPVHHRAGHPQCHPGDSEWH